MLMPSHSNCQFISNSFKTFTCISFFLVSHFYSLYLFLYFQLCPFSLWFFQSCFNFSHGAITTPDPLLSFSNSASHVSSPPNFSSISTWVFLLCTVPLFLRGSCFSWFKNSWQKFWWQFSSASWPKVSSESCFLFFLFLFAYDTFQ